MVAVVVIAPVMARVNRKKAVVVAVVEVVDLVVAVVAVVVEVAEVVAEALRADHRAQNLHLNHSPVTWAAYRDNSRQL